MAKHVKSDVTFPADASILYQPGLHPAVSLMEEEKESLPLMKNYGYLILNKYISGIWILICILFGNSAQQLKHRPSTFPAKLLAGNNMVQT